MLYVVLVQSCLLCDIAMHVPASCRNVLLLSMAQEVAFQTSSILVHHENHSHYTQMSNMYQNVTIGYYWCHSFSTITIPFGKLT